MSCLISLESHLSLWPSPLPLGTKSHKLVNALYGGVITFMPPKSVAKSVSSIMGEGPFYLCLLPSFTYHVYHISPPHCTHTHKLKIPKPFHMQKILFQPCGLFAICCTFHFFLLSFLKQERQTELKMELLLRSL